MTAFASDTFTDADNTLLTSHTATLGGAWARSSISSDTVGPKISSNKLVSGEAGVLGFYYVAATPAGADYTVSVDYTHTSGGDGEAAGACARMSTSAADGYHAVYFTSGSRLTIWKCVGGSFTELGSGVGYTVSATETYKVVLDVSGSSTTTLKAKMQRASDSQWLTSGGSWSATEQWAITQADSSSPITAAGKAGLRIQQGATPNCTIDNFLADEVATGATATTLSGPSSGTNGVASTNFTVGANGTITGTVTVTPSSGGGGGTFTPTTVAISSGTPTATFTYTPASTGAKTISISDDGGLTDATSLTYTVSAGAATATTLSGPSGGTVSVASTNFTVGANGTITGTVTVTPSSGGGGGTFTPTTVAISSGTPTATFTYTPASTGAKTISISDDGSLTDAASLTYTVVSGSTTTVDVTNSTLFFSPYNWYSDGAGSMAANNIKASSTYGQSNTPGAYLKFKITLATTGNVVLNLDNAHLSTISAGDFPIITVWRELESPVDTQLSGTSTQAITLASSLAAGTYQFVVGFKACGIDGGGDRWSTPRLSVKITGLTVPSDATMVAPVLRTDRAIIIGDSITEGGLNLSSTPGTAAQDAMYTWAHFLGAALDAEVGIIGFSSQGFEVTGAGGVPALSTAYDDYSSGRSRLVTGAFSPVPDWVAVAHGANDAIGGSLTTAIGTVLSSIRTAAGTAAPIYVLVPFNSYARSNFTGASLPSNTRLIDVASDGNDGSHLFYYPGNATPLHPTVYGSAYLAPRLQKLIERRGAKTARTVTVTLVNAGGTAQTGLSSLKWAFWDQITPDLAMMPADQGAVETTDGSGTLTITVNTTLAAAATGWLVVTNSDGNAATNHKAFAGPVVLS